MLGALALVQDPSQAGDPRLLASLYASEVLSQLRAVSFQPAQASQVALDREGQLTAWSQGRELHLTEPDGRLLGRRTLPREPRALAFSDQGLLYVGAGPSVRALSLPSLADRWEADLSEANTSALDVLDQDGTWVAAGDADGGLYLWHEGELAYALEAHDDQVTAVDLAPGGLLVSASGDHTVAVWDPEGYELHRVELEGAEALSLGWSGQDVIMGDATGRLLRWTPGGALHQLGSQRAPIEALTVSPEGLVAAGETRGVVALWREGVRTESVQAHGGRVRTVRVDRESLLTGGADGVRTYAPGAPRGTRSSAVTRARCGPAFSRLTV